MPRRLLPKVYFTEKEKDPKQIRRDELRHSLQSGKIHTISKPGKGSWLSDPLMHHIRSAVTEDVVRFIKVNSVVCDPLDLQFQVLCRSSTYKPEELFLNGTKLRKYMDENGAFVDWKNMSNLDPKELQEFRIDKRRLSGLIDEQYRVIEQRLRRSALPISDLLRSSEEFEGEGWHIKKTERSLYASNKSESRERSIPLTIGEIDIRTALAIFNDLHYIHTPRAEVALGLFVSGQSLPFSVVGASRIDRRYKEDALLMQGYDYERCWDVTRLYNVGRAPKNTSSMMISQIVRYLRVTYPNTRACLTAITPSFAEGKSVIAGGFLDPVLLRSINVSFCQVDTENGTAWERLTQRRLAGYNGQIIKNELPLLPVMELLRGVGRLDYDPLIEKDKIAVER